MPEARKSDLVDVELVLLTEGELSLKVKRDEEDREVIFLPLSLIEWEPTGGRAAMVTMPEWLAVDRGLI